MINNRQEIDQWLKANYKKLKSPEFMFGVDNNQSKEEEWDTSDFRILVVMLSNGVTRAVSSTFASLFSQASRAGNIFMDYSFLPQETDFNILVDNDIPVIFGNVSHAPMKDYDLVLVSHSILPELVSIPKLWKYSGIPFTIEERDKMELPLICHGGAAANEASILYGDIYKDGVKIGKSLLDIAQYGYAEGVLDSYLKDMIAIKKEGIHPAKDRVKFQETLIDREICKDYLFHIKYYRWNYKEDKFTIDSIECLDPRLPQTVKYNRITDATLPQLGWDRKVFHVDGSNADSLDIQCSSGCSGQSSCCSFCMEATVAGGYHEIPFEEMEKRMWNMKRNCAPNTSSLFSYNLNYYYRFMDIIKLQSSMFSRINMINERIDVVANAPDQLALAKATGLKKFSGAVEGIGERLRNQLFNKNLTRETLMKAVNNIMDHKFMEMKFGLILSGYETQEDFEEFIDEIDEIIRIRQSKGSNTALRSNVTPLVLYSQIALRHLPRITAENSYNNVRNLTWLIEEYRKRGLRIKINGKGPGTYLEQLMLDFGPAGTNWLVQCTENGFSFYRGFKNTDKEISTQELEREGYDKFFFTKGRPKDWIFPNDHIFYATQEVKDMWWRRTEAFNFDAPLCLKTLAQPNPKCYGCKMCEPQHIKFMLNRPLGEHTTVDEILESLTEVRTNNITRIVVQKKSGYDYMNAMELSHFITSRFLQRDDNLVDSFYKVAGVSINSVISKGQKDWFTGEFYFDIHWMYPTPTGSLDKYIESINEELKSCKVVKIHYNVGDLKVSNSKNLNFYGVLSNYPLSRLKEKYMNFSWDVRVATKSMGTELTLERKSMPELKDNFLFIPYKDKIMFFCSLPEGVNPLLAIGSIIAKPYQWMLENTECVSYSHTQPVDATCRCGKPLTFNRNKNTTDKLCPICQGKLILKQLSSR